MHLYGVLNSHIFEQSSSFLTCGVQLLLQNLLLGTCPVLVFSLVYSHSMAQAIMPMMRLWLSTLQASPWRSGLLRACWTG